MWAIKGGISDYNHITNKVFYPSSYFYEVSVGRGTASDDAEFYKGLRGYLEVSLRNEKPKLTGQDLEIANGLGISIPNNPIFMSIKMGAASVKTNLPIVGQQQGAIAYQVRSHFLFSLRNANYSAWKVNVAGHTECFASTTWSCGIDLGHFHLNNTQKTAAAEDLSDFSTLATSFRWQRTTALSLRAKLQWSMIWNRQTINFVRVPSLNLSMIKAF